MGQWAEPNPRLQRYHPSLALSDPLVFCVKRVTVLVCDIWRNTAVDGAVVEAIKM